MNSFTFVSTSIPVPNIDEEGQKYYGLVIAIDEYNGNEWSTLKTPVNDANAIKDVLLNKYGFEEVVTLYDQQATRANIIDYIDRIAQNITNNDNLLIYFSGHGIEIGNEGYWVPSDARTKERSQLIPNSEIKNALAKTVSKHALVMVDACFSGTIFKSSNLFIENDGSDTYYKKVDDLVSRQAITAGGLEPVLDGAGKHSTFARYIIKNLKKNQQTKLDANELFKMVKLPVQANSPNIPQFGHIQNAGHEGGQFIFKINKETTGACAFGGVTMKEGAKMVFSTDGGMLHAIVNEYDKKVYYQWLKGSVTLDNKTPNLRVTESGTYSVLVTTDDECSDAAVIDVTIALPQIEVVIEEGSKVTFTNGGTLHASLSAPKEDVVYEWLYNNYIISQEPTLDIKKAGQYKVVIRLKDGRKIATAETQVEIKARTYTVQIGDDMARIARKFYSDAGKVDFLYKSNIGKVTKGELLRVGTELNVPLLDKEEVSDNAPNSSKRIYIAANEDMPPLSQIGLYKNGMLTEIVKETMREMGEVPVVNFMSGNKVKSQAFTGKSTAAFPFVYSKQDANFFHYSEPLFKELTIFFVSKTPQPDARGKVKEIKYNREKDLKGKRVAIVRGFASEKLMDLQQKGILGLMAKNTWEECFQLLKDGKVDMVAAPQMVGILTLKSVNSVSLDDFKMLSKPFETTDFYLVVSKQSPDGETFLARFNAAFQKLNDAGSISKIQNTHIDIFQNER